MPSVYVWFLLSKPDVEQMLGMHREEGQDLKSGVAHTTLSCNTSSL